MKKVKLTAGLLLIFILGAFTGIFGMGLYHNYRIKHPVFAGHPRPVEDRVIERLSKDLDLTKEQRKEIESIIKLTQERMADIRKRYMPELQDANEQSFNLMREKLNPEQKEKLERIRQRIRTSLKTRGRPGLQP